MQTVIFHKISPLGAILLEMGNFVCYTIKVCTPLYLFLGVLC